jgi:hypothetical protein
MHGAAGNEFAVIFDLSLAVCSRVRNTLRAEYSRVGLPPTPYETDHVR